MIEPLATLLPVGEAAILATVLVFFRIGAVMALLPAFGEQSVPLRVRLALAVVLTAVVAPAVAPDIADTAPDGLTTAPLVAEIINGLLLGIGFRLIVVALQIAGTIAANMTSLSQILGGAGVDPQPAIASLLVIAGLALAALGGLHVKVASALILSYEALPAGEMPGTAAMAEWGTGEVAHAFAFAFVLAAPFTIAALVYNLALGAINRAMPQLMVAFVGAPAVTWGGLFLLVLSGPLMMSVWSETFDALLADPLRGR